MIEKNSLFAKNLRTIREFMGKTQTAFGDKVYLSNNTISKYENSERRPDETTLNVIANYVGIPVNALLNEEITTEYLLLRNKAVENDSLAELGWSLLTFITSEDAQKNDSFAKAYECFERICMLDYPNASMFVECKRLFYESFTKMDVIEGAANAILLILYEYIYFLSPDEVLQKARDNSLRFRDFEDADDRAVEKRLSYKKKFLKNNEKMFFSCIYSLKHNPSTFEIADYYMALRYILDMVDNGEESLTNQTVGLLMMSELQRIKNRYALKFYETFNSFVDNIYSL